MGVFGSFALAKYVRYNIDHEGVFKDNTHGDGDYLTRSTDIHTTDGVKGTCTN